MSIKMKISKIHSLLMLWVVIIIIIVMYGIID